MAKAPDEDLVCSDISYKYGRGGVPTELRIWLYGVHNQHVFCECAGCNLIRAYHPEWVSGDK